MFACHPSEFVSRNKRGIPLRCAKALIYAGLDLFGKYSFDGTSSTDAREQTKVNLAAIQYYFGGKGGLYLAVANHIVEQVNKSLGPKISEIQEILKQGPPSRQKSLGLLCELVDLVVTRFVGIPETDKWLGILIREQLCPLKLSIFSSKVF